MENEIEKLAIEAWEKEPHNDMDLFCDTFTKGYKAALSKGNWTDEDMLGCWAAALKRREAYYADKTYGVPNFEEYLQSLKAKTNT